jgi:hypothetical protein
MTTFPIDVTVERLIEFLSGPGRGTLRSLSVQELGRDVYRDPSPTVDDAAGAILLLQALEGKTGEELRAWLHASDEAAAFRASGSEGSEGNPTTPGDTPSVHVEGLKFVTERGEQWWMAFVSSFRLYERYLRGEDIQPVLRETVDVGGNGLRVFGAFDFGSPQNQRLYPAEHPDYYTRLPDFYALVQSYGLYLQFTAFADTQRSVPGRDAQVNHWEAICEQTRDSPNVLLERVNEANAHENRVDAELLKPEGICSSFGSNGAGSDPPGPFWDYADLHSERPAELPKLLQSTTTLAFAVHGYTGFSGTQRATVVSEPIGFADTDQPGRRVANPEVAYLLGLGCRWGAGGTAHSDNGVQSILLSPTQRVCVEQFMRGIWG